MPWPTLLMGLIHRLQLSLLAVCGVLFAAPVVAEALPEQQPIGTLEVVAKIRGAMPTGIAVSSTGRLFVNYPRWGDRVQFTVAEIVNGVPVAFPSQQMNALADRNNQTHRIVSAQSVVVDPSGRTLWIVDTGVLRPHPVSYGGAKLIAVDLQTNQVVRTIFIDQDVLASNTYLNDVRFAMRTGKAGYAFVTDSSSDGGIIVVDLDTGRSWRRLGKTRFTMSDPGFYPMVEAKLLMVRPAGQPAERFNVGSDGLAVSADEQRLFFRPLTSRHLYSVAIAALINRSVQEKQLQALVVDHGQISGASDGLEADRQGRILLTDYEHNAIHRFSGSVSTLETLMSSSMALWPDSMALADDGYLYFTANQLHRQASFHEGRDMRVQPYMVFRIKTDSRPIRSAAVMHSSLGQTR